MWSQRDSGDMSGSFVYPHNVAIDVSLSEREVAIRYRSYFDSNIDRFAVRHQTCSLEKKSGGDFAPAIADLGLRPTARMERLSVS